jgi:cardiolipin synthase (CMP-forming)
VSGRVLTLPNLLTVLRGCAALPVAMAVRGNRFGVALAIVILAGLTDGLDGIIARKTGQTSDVGRLLDPIADKTLLVVTFLAVSLPGAGFEPLPLWLAGLAITRDVGIIAAGIGIYLATGFSGFSPTLLGKANTCFEIGVVLLFLVTRLAGLPEPLLTAGVYATAATITISGIHYVFHARRQLAARTP